MAITIKYFPSPFAIFLIIILLMELNHRQGYWQIGQDNVILPFKRYKAMRNNSMPDLTELKHQSPRAEGKFHYNKWFIKPEERLKTKIVTQRSQLQLEPCSRYFYESLYQENQKETNRAIKANREKQNAVKKICSDGQNVKLLTTFRNRKQQNSKRVPAVIDYIINFHKKLEKESRGTLVKKSRYFY